MGRRALVARPPCRIDGCQSEAPRRTAAAEGVAQRHRPGPPDVRGDRLDDSRDVLELALDRVGRSVARGTATAPIDREEATSAAQHRPDNPEGQVIGRRPVDEDAAAASPAPAAARTRRPRSASPSAEAMSRSGSLGRPRSPCWPPRERLVRDPCRRRRRRGSRALPCAAPAAPAAARSSSRARRSGRRSRPCPSPWATASGRRAASRTRGWSVIRSTCGSMWVGAGTALHPRGVVPRRRAREDREEMPVRPDAHQHDVEDRETRALSRAGPPRRGPLRTEPRPIPAAVPRRRRPGRSA